MLTMSDRLMNDVLAEVLRERTRQDKKWGEQNHHPMDWLSILGEEFGEVCEAANRAQWDTHVGEFPFRQECIEVAAVAVGIVESLDRGKWKEKTERRAPLEAELTRLREEKDDARANERILVEKNGKLTFELTRLRKRNEIWERWVKVRRQYTR